jgi:hypothetical protein
MMNIRLHGKPIFHCGVILQGELCKTQPISKRKENNKKKKNKKNMELPLETEHQIIEGEMAMTQMTNSECYRQIKVYMSK